MHIGGGEWAGKALDWTRQQVNRAARTSAQGYAVVAPHAEKALGWTQHQVSRAARTPAAGLVVVAPLVLASAVAASPGPATPDGATLADAPVQTVAAVTPNRVDRTGPSVVPVSQEPAKFHFATSSITAPPPAVVVSSPGALGIPAMALTAYRNAERMMAQAQPDCGISWNLLAGIGRIESLHANGGATDTRGNPVTPIYGPALDGTLPGNEVIVAGSSGGTTTYARAMGPMQFLPGTWNHYASDGDGDGQANPQNLFDATLAAARYLCSGGLNLRDQSQVISAVLRYNNSMPYTQNVLGWAAAYATGVMPLELPPITGPVPVLDGHLEVNGGTLGPDEINAVLGLGPDSDLHTQMPMFDLSGRGGALPTATSRDPLADAALAAQPPLAPACPFCPPGFLPPGMPGPAAPSPFFAGPPPPQAPPMPGPGVVPALGTPVFPGAPPAAPVFPGPGLPPAPIAPPFAPPPPPGFVPPVPPLVQGPGQAPGPQAPGPLGPVPGPPTLN